MTTLKNHSFESGQAAEFFHGLMELAAACYHLKQATFGARYLLTSAADLLSPCRPSYQGIDVRVWWHKSTSAAS
jgi:predicted metal-dependent hydrolase